MYKLMYSFNKICHTPRRQGGGGGGSKKYCEKFGQGVGGGGGGFISMTSFVNDP